MVNVEVGTARRPAGGPGTPPLVKAEAATARRPVPPAPGSPGGAGLVRAVPSRGTCGVRAAATPRDSPIRATVRLNSSTSRLYTTVEYGVMGVQV